MHRNRTRIRAAAALMTMVTGAAVLPGGGAAVAQPPLPGGGAAVAQPPRPDGGAAVLQTVPLAGPAARSARPATDPFSLIGVTWADPRAAVAGVVQVRTRSIGTGRWSGWQTLEADGGAPGDARGSTDPLWVGPSDGVEARVTGTARLLPAGLRVDLINPDAAAARPGATGSGTVAPRSATGSGTVAPRSATGPGTVAPRSATGAAGSGAVAAGRAVALPARPVPRMVTRAGWGANEGMVRGVPEYTGAIEAFFVHHTASGNGYSCAQSAGIVRGIQAYQVRSRGWDDIGYNFLVDRCGTIFEGRAGGVGRSVLGAHTLGFNANASSIAVIGTYGGTGVPASVRTAIAAVAAYKLGAYGNAPDGRVVLTSGGGNRYPLGARAVFDRIAGHRDAGRTDCPGDALYGQLPAIRAIAGAAPAGLRFARMGGAVRRGPLLYTKGLIRPLWDVATPSALINRFEVWVDGELTAATPGMHRTAAVRLAPGGHTVTVRALHLSGRATTVTSRIVSDASAPVFSAGPEVSLRPGSLSGSVPIRLDWAVADVNGLSAVGLVEPVTVALGTTARSRNGTVRPGVPTTFTVRAADRAGNAVDASVTRTPVVLSEAASVRIGSWRRLSNRGYLGGAALGAAAEGASATWTFRGRSAALVFSRGPGAGRVRVVVDGAGPALVDLHAATAAPRQAVWTRSWSGSDRHTVRVEVEGTPSRPGVVIDGLVHLE